MIQTDYGLKQEVNMVESYTGTIKTNGEWQLVETLTGITFTVGNNYTMNVINSAEIKVANAIFPVTNEKFQYKAGSEDFYIKTQNGYTCTLTILENEEE